MLSHEGLKPHYDKVTWLFVTRNFNGDAVDRESLRTHDRFGITTWPQIPLFDPRDDRVLAWLPRSLPGFVAGLERHADAVPKASAAAQAAAVTVKEAIALQAAGKGRAALRLLEEVAAEQDDAGVWLHARELVREWSGKAPDLGARLDDPDVRERAIAVEEITALEPKQQKKFGKRLREALADEQESLIVRVRAVRFFAAGDPAVLVENAKTLLAVPSDPFRFEVLTALETRPDAALVPTFLDLFDGAGGRIPSGNPNVLRIHVAKCLGAAGDERAVAPLAAVTEQTDARNGLTYTALDALAAIGERHRGAVRQRVVEALCRSFPPGVEDAGLDDFGERAQKVAWNGAERTRDALAKVAIRVPPLPEAWTRQSRAEYLKALQKVSAR